MSTGVRALVRVSSCIALGLLASFAQCRGRAGGETEAQVSRALCASACASLATDCGDPEPLPARQSRCLELCTAARRDALLAKCAGDQDRALRCVSTATVSCEKVSSLRTALEQGSGVEGCQAEFERLLRCNLPCREAGVVRSATRNLPIAGKSAQVRAEQVSLGCGPDEHRPERHSPQGAPCEHFTVCSQGLCPCPGSNAAYLARACVGGRCAEGELACRLVPIAVGHDPCPAR